MKHLIDRLILYAFVFYAMCTRMQGAGLIATFYVIIFISAMSACVVSANNIVGLIYAMIILGAFFVEESVFLMPFMIYDLIQRKGKISYVLCLVAAVNILYRGDIYILLVACTGGIISVYTDKLINLQVHYKKLRDDDAQYKEEIDKKNAMMLEAKEKDIYTATLLERNRIAREIHDNVGHVLSRTILQMGALLTIHKNEAICADLEAIRENLDDAMNNIRTSVHDLYDESIDLNAALQEVVKPLRDSEKFDLSFYCDAGDNVPRNVKQGVIAIVKEGVTNIIKHSQNNMVDIRFNEHPSMYQLIIHDYGKNSRVYDIKNHGLGLENIRTRTVGLGGKLIIDTDDGFKIFITIEKGGAR